MKALWGRSGDFPAGLWALPGSSVGAPFPWAGSPGSLAREPQPTEQRKAEARASPRPRPHPHRLGL